MAPKVKIRAASVAAEQLLNKIRSDTPPEIAAQIRQEAADKAVADVYGADWKQHVDAHGQPQEQGIGSTVWLLNVDEATAERHFQALERWKGPGAARAERERIARLKGRK